MDRFQWVEQLNELFDAKNADGFAAYFDDDGIFRFGNQPLVQGRNSIWQYCVEFFKRFQSCNQQIESMLENSISSRIDWEGEVTYVRWDGSTVQLPFCNVIHMNEEDKIQEYVVHIDNSSLFAL